jgi:hypothetical protein
MFNQKGASIAGKFVEGEPRSKYVVVDAVNQYSKLDDIMGKGGGIPSVCNRRDDALSHAKHLAAEFDGGGKK